MLTNDGVCCGALVWNADHGKTFVWAKQTILCTGGAGQIYRESTNPAVATGDGHAIAYRAGAELRDMEFMQFHPTVLYIAGSSRSLITEAMRGEGAWLVDSTGHRFMSNYDERGELAPRDVVSQAIVAQMEKTRQPCVYLDLSHRDPEFVRNRFPGIAKTCAEFGIDVARDPIPVRPGAHYMIGGVTVDHDGRTTLDRLWAAGEVSSSGLHGANRLASNSLLEGLVYGAHAGRGASASALEQRDSYEVIPLENPPVESPTEPLDLADIRNSLKSLMWRAAGVHRSGPQLGERQRDDPPLVPLRARAAICQPDRLGTRKHADSLRLDRRVGARTHRIARRPPAERLSGARRRPLATTFVGAARRLARLYVPRVELQILNANGLQQVDERQHVVPQQALLRRQGNFLV